MEPQNVTRKLAAILSADVKGYSRLIREDELGTIRTLTAYREVMVNLIGKGGGRVVDSPGDNLLAEFGSVVDAVQSAVEIQRVLKVRNAELPEGRKMEFRIGINLGDVVVEGERLYGDGVNIAARLEELAEPGGICVSGDAYRQVKDKLNLGFEDLGEQEVKNIAEPVRAYRVRLEAGAAGTVTAAKKTGARRWVIAAAVAVVVIGGAAVWNFYLRGPQIEPASLEKFAFPLPKDPSIAVLPFANMSGDPEQEYFADGLTETLITQLAKVPGMFVIARNSTFAYKKKPVKVRQVAEELGVQYVLEGSVQKVGDRVRITAQLIDALKGHHLWAERYDRAIKDTFAVQDEIARKVVAALKGEVQFRLPAQGATTAEGLEHFLRGLAHTLRFTKEDNALARQMFEKAIELEPKWVAAWVLLASTYRLEFLFGWSENPRQSLERSVELAKKALAMDDTHPAANGLMGRIYQGKREHEKAIAYGRKAVALAPNRAHQLVFLAMTLTFSGQPQEAVELIKKAMRLNPKYPLFYLQFLGHGYRLSGQYDKSIGVLKEALVRQPNNHQTHLWLALAYSRKGEIEKARGEVEKVLQLRPKHSAKSYANVNPYKNPADLKHDIDALRKAGLPDNSPLPLPKKPSIAVLPFTNMSDDPKQEYFSDGITEDIITDLSKISGLFVIARNSSFTYKGKPVKVQQVGRDLGVRYVLEGSVRKVGGKVRITAQLVDAKTGNNLWAERYDRELKDVFAVQNDVTRRVVSELAVTLKADEQERLFRRHTENLEAYETFLRARRLLEITLEPNVLAERKMLFERIIELDPHFAGGYAGLSFVYSRRVRAGRSTSRERDIKRALELAQQAVATDDSFGWSYVALGSAYLMSGEHDRAVAAMREAIRIQPSDGDAYVFLGFYLHWSGRADDAIDALKMARRLNPKYPRWMQFLGMAYFTAGRYEEAIATIKLNYPFLSRVGANALCFLAASYAAMGQDEKARAEMTVFLDKKPGRSLSNYRHPRLYKRKEDRDRYLELLRRAGMPE